MIAHRPHARRSETERRILQAVAACTSPWATRACIIGRSGRSHTTVLRWLREYVRAGWLEQHPQDAEAWRLTAAGQARLAVVQEDDAPMDDDVCEQCGVPLDSGSEYVEGPAYSVPWDEDAILVMPRWLCHDCAEKAREQEAGTKSQARPVQRKKWRFIRSDEPPLCCLIGNLWAGCTGTSPEGQCLAATPSIGVCRLPAVEHPHLEYSMRDGRVGSRKGYSSYARGERYQTVANHRVCRLPDS